MAESENALLRRFIDVGDAGAFAEIVRRYAGPVYGTCLRVLADGDKAADATQETFFQLVRRGQEVRESLGGWLHRVAVRKAVDRIRADSARRRSEERHLDDRAAEGCTWNEVSPYVDEALDALDDATRVLLIRHYLEGRSMTELAENAAQSAPVRLLQQVGKMVLVHAGTPEVTGSLASSTAALAGGMAAAAHTKLVAVVAATVLVGAGVVAYRTLSSEPVAAPLPKSSVGTGGGRTYTSRTGSLSRQASLPVAVEEETPDPRPAQKKTVEDGQSFWSPAGTEKAAGSVSDAPETQTAGDVGFQLDLSSPESTVRSFIKAWTLGDAESILACWLPTAGDYEDIRRGVYADPNDPQQRSYYEGKQVFLSLDPDAEMPVIETKENDDGGTSITWRVTFKRDVTMGGQTFHAGDTQDVEATVRKCGDSWLIDNM